MMRNFNATVILPCFAVFVLLGRIVAQEPAVFFESPQHDDVVLGSTLCLTIRTRNFRVPEDGLVQLYINGRMSGSINQLGTMALNDMALGTYRIEAMLVDNTEHPIVSSQELQVEIEPLPNVTALVKDLVTLHLPTEHQSQYICGGVKKYVTEQKLSPRPVSGSASLVHLGCVYEWCKTRFANYARYHSALYFTPMSSVHKFMESVSLLLAHGNEPSQLDRSVNGVAIFGNNWIVTDPLRPLVLDNVLAKNDDDFLVLSRTLQPSDALILLRPGNSTQAFIRKAFSEIDTASHPEKAFEVFVCKLACGSDLPVSGDAPCVLRQTCPNVRLLESPGNVGPLLDAVHIVNPPKDDLKGGLGIDAHPDDGRSSIGTAVRNGDTLKDETVNIHENTGTDRGYVEVSESSLGWSEGDDRGWAEFADEHRSDNSTLSDKLSNEAVVGIVIPFRKRSNNLRRFIAGLHRELEGKIRYQVLVVDQTSADVLDVSVPATDIDSNEQYFNRGALLNAAYLLAAPSCDFAVFHDVDFIPRSEISWMYQLDAVEDGPLQLLGRVLSAGGAVSSTHEHYYETGGYPNSFWGWGYEDHEYQYRIEWHGHRVNRDHWNPGSFDHYDGFDVLAQPAKTTERRQLLWERNRARFVSHRLLGEHGEGDGVGTTRFQAVSAGVSCGHRCTIVKVLLEDDQLAMRDAA